LLRSVWERRAELALLRALGFREAALGVLVLAENVFLLVAGTAIGTLTALLAVAPHLSAGSGTVPVGRLGPLLGAVLAVALPRAARPERSLTGLLFSGLAGAAGALGAIAVIFATKEAFGAAAALQLEDKGAYKLYIAPLIFGLAPVINTLVSVVWHPKKGQPVHFGWATPHPTLWLGIVLVGLGAATVLYSKELSEAAPVAAAQAQEEQVSHPS